MQRALGAGSAAAWRFTTAALLLCSCSRAESRLERDTGAASARDGPFTYTARTEVGYRYRSGPLVLSTTISYRNTGASPAPLRFAPGCLVALRVRHAEDARQWDQVQWRSALARRSGFLVACGDTAAAIEVPGGGVVHVRASEAPTISEVLGDSLPAGEYLVRAIVYPLAGSAMPPAELDAGRVQLRP
jgi:hypothetical protein